MSKNINKHGLKRSSLDAVTKQQIRQRCGFGCIVCGELPWDYAHIEPPFEDALRHDPACMALLCDRHHREFDATPRLLSMERIRAAMLSPRNATSDPVWRSMLGPGQPTVQFGGQLLFGSEVRIECNGHVVFSVCSHPDPLVPWELSGRIYGASGERLVHFERNELHANHELADINFKASRLTVHSTTKDVLLEIAFDADQGLIRVEHLQMRLGGGHFLLVGPGRAEVAGPNARVLLGTPYADKELGDFVEKNGVSRQSVTGNSFMEGSQWSIFALASDVGYAMCQFQGVAGRPTVLALNHPALGTPRHWASSNAIDNASLRLWRKKYSVPRIWMQGIALQNTGSPGRS
jgi:hypothetical protein